ncbi:MULTISPECIES: deiodinase-like protein [unclassified Francisella]|uniref:deiodinase-like protein n=1 Tax=unclassified Francisella TaxID=2610885 RepID=UPI002E32E6DF|nr:MULTISPECIES: deiodinase-like protein [unclassified Francisella]MED7819465.1 deiodinase-like protein [Francisella sp. 19S2-4]MED7830254.1 deiodinase-like protein [Francisella sp. 19S2-10]
MSYNYDNFSSNHYDFEISKGLGVGDKAVDIKLETADGNYKNILDFNGNYLVLEMGSITCPLFQGRRDSMLKIAQDYTDLSFAILYVREAHPGLNIKKHESYNDKKTCAIELKNIDGEQRAIFIDDIDGSAHQIYGSMPNAVFIINKEKEIVFKLDWNNPILVRKAIKALLAGKELPKRDFFYPVNPRLAKRVLQKAGKGSAKDFLSSLPTLIYKNVIKRNLRAFFRKK